jgi:hypothetical protein
VDIEQIRFNLKNGYDIVSFSGKYHASRDEFSKAFGKEFSLSLDPHNALRFWEESHEIMFQKVTNSHRSDSQEDLVNETKDFLYRFDYNVDSMMDLWTALNVVIGFCVIDSDYNENDYLEITMKKDGVTFSVKTSSKDLFKEVQEATTEEKPDIKKEKKKKLN